MNRPLLNKAFAVGLLVAVCAVAFLVAFTFFRRGGYDKDDSYVVHVFFKDATGLTWKSRVQIAGIQIGEVERISLVGARARLDLRIQKDVDLHRDACVSKRFPSALLPDAILDTVPGAPPAAMLRDLPPDQREITCVNEGITVEALLESMSRIADDISVVSGELANTVAGSQGSIQDIIQNLARISSQLATTVEEGQDQVQAILDNAQAFTGTLRTVAEQDQGRYRAIAANVEDASGRLVRILDDVQKILGEDQPELRDSVAGVRQSLDRLNRSMEEVEKVVVNIGQGKGVAGKLLADERLGEKVGTALEGATDYVDRLVKLKIEVQLRSEWLWNENGSKTFAGFKLLPRPDKFYLFELVSDPRGVDTVTNETISVQDPSGNVTTTRTSRTLNEDKLRFSAQLGKRYGPTTLRVGIIESSGGAGADLHLLDDRLTLSFSMYQFDRPANVDYPNLKIWVNYTFLRYLYATAGTDDLLNRWDSDRFPGGRNFSFGRDIFIGGGLVFTDDDLKTLLGAGGSALSGAASQ
jgi:phospholipid/cholesterol/gamma-HCH transport system substrate-binding protein